MFTAARPASPGAHNGTGTGAGNLLNGLTSYVLLPTLLSSVFCLSYDLIHVTSASALGRSASIARYVKSNNEPASARLTAQPLRTSAGSLRELFIQSRVEMTNGKKSEPTTV